MIVHVRSTQQKPNLKLLAKTQKTHISQQNKKKLGTKCMKCMKNEKKKEIKDTYQQV